MMISLNAYTQEGLKHFTAGIGGGLIRYPEGNLYGFTQSYYADYLFANHFGARVSLDFGTGQKNDNQFFDLIKSVAAGIGLVYVPVKGLRSFNVSTSLIVHNNTRIMGTKDEVVSQNFALSKFTSYAKSAAYGLMVGIQYPIIERDHFFFAAKIDSWFSGLTPDAMSAKLLIGYTF